MAWSNIGTLTTGSQWVFSQVIPTGCQIIRLSGGSSWSRAWVGFFKESSEQEILDLRRFTATGKGRMLVVPTVNFALRVGALESYNRFGNKPESIVLNVAAWIEGETNE